jgi:hypothetical protein
MANDYADSFAGDPYFIHKGEQLSAAGMTKALNTKEKVANKTTTIDGSSTDAQYPSAKAAYTALNTKEDSANKKDTLSNSSTEYPSSKAVSIALANKVEASDLTALQTSVNGLETTIGNLQEKLPIGTILMYDGASWQDNVTLKGWYSCNRTNYNHGLTPNLEDKFIKGKGNKADTGDGQMTLGAQHLPAHKHSITDPGHTHTTKCNSRVQVGSDNGVSYGQNWGDSDCGYTSENQTGITETNNNTDGGQSFDVLPSYYSVIYIKKMA